LGRNLLQLVLGIHRRDISGARHRMSGLAAARGTSPGQVATGVAPRDFAFIPRYTEHFRSYAMAIADRLRAQVADAGLNIKLAIRLDDEQSVESHRAAHEATGGDANTACLGAAALRLRFSLVPAERGVTFI